MESIRDDVLSDSEFAALPRVYKKAVKLSADKEEVLLSAKEALTEFQRDYGSLTKGAGFGSPPKTIQSDIVDIKTREDAVSQLKKSMLDRFKTQGLMK